MTELTMLREERVQVELANGRWRVRMWKGAEHLNLTRIDAGGSQGITLSVEDWPDLREILLEAFGE